MQSNIEIKFLMPDELRNARNMDYRYENVDETNLGFADKVKNRIFVRAGLSEDLTKYLISHELEHLFEFEGSHEDEHGIRHKKNTIGSFFDTIFNPVTWFHPERQNSWANLSAFNPFGNGAYGSKSPMPVAYGLFDHPTTAGGGEGGNYEFINPYGDATIPKTNLGQGFGLTSAQNPSGTGTGEQGGGIGIQNVGTGQAGITLGGQRGMEEFSGGQQQFGQEQNPIGFNAGNGGILNLF